MKHIAPAYYTSFRCSADRCRHNCCIGWEIDIDSTTAAFYDTVEGTLGQRLRTYIQRTEDGCSFLLDEQERCPFLNTNGLCDIITALGEDALCQICADHPRFYNVFSDRLEIGLGLCCEEATRLILTSEDDTLSVTDDDGVSEILCEEEADLLTKRDALFAVAHDASKSICEREDALLVAVGYAPLSAGELLARLQPLERLEADWDEILITLRNAPDKEPPPALQLAFERLLVYFLFRHLADALDDGRLTQRVAFAAHSVKVLRLLCAANGDTLDTLLELARRYSAEVEYSQDNMKALLTSF